ncbi:Uncharacterised protein [Vibrio cholerae]|nr:Uncharacterised protein [Vibrio cholerae]CSD37497.1 Uncharacterised protein [Vibrio cholerae]CSI71524.1 Uncharacterised protein [Vibrio cholerae]
MLFSDLSHLSNRVQHAGGGFAVHNRHMRNCRIMGQHIGNLIKIRLRRFSGSNNTTCDIQVLRDLRDACAISTVINHEQLIGG